MMKFAPLVLTALLLAGCKEQTVEMKNASVADVANAMTASDAEPPKLQPGLWRATMTMNNISVPGASPEVTEQIRARMAAPKIVDDCLTPAKAEKPFDGLVAEENKACRYDRFVMGDGQIDAVLVCPIPDGTRRISMQGTYTPTQYQMAMNATAQSKGRSAVDVTMTLKAERVGECAAGANQ